MLIGNRLNKGQAELANLEHNAERTRTSPRTRRNSNWRCCYKEAGAEPDAVAEQIGILGSLLQDNRKHLRAIEDLTRLWDSQQDLDKAQRRVATTPASPRNRNVSASTQDGVKAKAELDRRRANPLTVTATCWNVSAWPAAPASRNCAHSCKMTSHARSAAARNILYHQPEALLQSLGRHDESEQATAQKAVDQLRKS